MIISIHKQLIIITTNHMGVCSSKKQNYSLQRSKPQRNIEIDFVKLLEYNRKKEVKDSKAN